MSVGALLIIKHLSYPILSYISVGISVNISVDILAEPRSSLGQVSGKCRVSVGRASVKYQFIYQPSDR